MKIFKISMDLDKYEFMFTITNTFKIENSYFSKEEIKKYLYFTDIKNFSLMNEIDMRRKENIPLADLKKYITLATEYKINKFPDIIYISGFGDTILLSLKAKEYIQKKYKDKNIDI